MVSHICGPVGLSVCEVGGYIERLVRRQPYAGLCFFTLTDKRADPTSITACGHKNKCSGQIGRDDRYPRFWQHRNRNRDRALSLDHKL